LLALNLSFRIAIYRRIFQAAGLSVLVCADQYHSYAGISEEQNNQVSGMMNVMRNLGGSVGIRTL